MSKPKKWDTMTPEDQRAWDANKREIVRRYQASPKGKGTLAQRRNTPVFKENHKGYNAKYLSKPEAKAKVALRLSRPEMKAAAKKYNDKYFSNPAKRIKNRQLTRNARDVISDHYVAHLLSIKTSILKGHPDIIEAKREHIRAVRQLNHQNKNENA